MGIRAVPHLPCSWHCKPTQEMAAKWLDKWPEASALQVMLRWPVKYSSLHGIAIITTPVYKIVTATDYMASEATLEYRGLVTPAESPSGLTFPFTLRKATTSPAQFLSPALWQDNGFPSYEAMTAAHAPLVARAQSFTSVLDLGAGNGYLLEQLPASTKIGVECEEAKVKRAQRRGNAVLHGRIQQLPDLLPDRTFEGALISQRRLEEMSDAELRTFDQWVRAHITKELLVYSYDEPRGIRVQARGAR